MKLLVPKMYVFTSNAFVMPKGTIGSSIKLAIIHNDKHNLTVASQTVKEFKYNKFTRLLIVDTDIYKNLKERDCFFVMGQAKVDGEKIIAEFTAKYEEYKKNENSIH